MMASTDFETALAEVARAAVPELADWCAITLVDQSGDLKPVAVAHQDPERERLAWDLSSRYPARADDPEGVPKAIRTGQTEHVPEIPDAMLVASAADDEHLRLLRELDLRAGLIVPLKTPDRTLGALTLVFAESDRRFTRDVMMLAEALAARAALAIENARLATERSHIARTLQDSLRPPRLPEIPMLDAAARYRAAGVQNEVGGDFYDVFETGSDTWTAILGDVSGKGPEAAAVTALARHTLWAAARREPSPIKNLELLNEALLGDDATESRFCTVVYARVCPAADGTEVTLSNAGHLPPLLLRADGTVEQVAGHGTLMGAVPDPEFALETLSLQPGELLLLYTDGVTEVRTTDLELGERRLRETLAGCVGKPAEEVVRLVEQAAVDLQEGEPRDDMALLALRAAPVAD
jgi:serine phosphatase RsbU (regulator of sigma subunit)